MTYIKHSQHSESSLIASKPLLELSGTHSGQHLPEALEELVTGLGCPPQRQRPIILQPCLQLRRKLGHL